MFSHGTSIGTSREQRLRNVLARILPPVVEIGQGQILFADGNRSPQCDVILFDGRCPRFIDSNDLGVYPAEGVVASIEVKSRFDATSLYGTLDHLRRCIPKSMNFVNLTDEQRREFKSDGAISRDLFPKTYALGFSSNLDAGKMSDVVRRWVRERSVEDSYEGHFLPRVVAIPGVVGMATDIVRRVEFDPADTAEIRDLAPSKPVHGCIDVECGVQVLLSDIVLEVARRIAPTHHTYGMNLAGSAAVPYHLYGDSFRSAQQTWLMAKTATGDSDLIVEQFVVRANYPGSPTE